MEGSASGFATRRDKPQYGPRVDGCDEQVVLADQVGLGMALAAKSYSRPAARAAYNAEATGHPGGANGVFDLLDGRPGGIHAYPPPGCVTEARMLHRRAASQAPSCLGNIALSLDDAV
jgi:hypothetical protein